MTRRKTKVDKTWAAWERQREQQEGRLDALGDSMGDLIEKLQTLCGEFVRQSLEAQRLRLDLGLLDK